MEKPSTNAAPLHWIDFAGLHPAVADVAEGLFGDGHYYAAVFEAFKALEVRVRDQSSVDSSGRDLMSRAFSDDSPPIDLSVEKGKAGRDEREGFRFIFMGAMQGIRNPGAHGRIRQDDSVRALEYLALASMLFRRLDDAGQAEPQSKVLLYLSSGGTCRDPMAAAITEKLLEKRGITSVRVKGLALSGVSRGEVSYAARRAIEGLYGEDVLRDYRPNSISSEEIEQADLVLVMAHHMLTSKVLPLDKTYVFKDFFGLEGDIEDPWPDGRDTATLQRYSECATEMKDILETGFETMRAALGV